jgi:hypothetical protein
MKIRTAASHCVSLFLVVLVAAFYAVPAAIADSGGLNESAIKTYLEKQAPGDPGSCLVENMNVEIIGIADPVPGKQTEVFYKFDYDLRCNRGKEAKQGQGVLKAVRLRDGKWMDRDTLSVIPD